MYKIWNVKPRIFDDEIKQLMFNRGIIDKNADKKRIDRFLNPNFKTDFHDPNLLPDFEKVANRIKKAVDSSEKIGIFADYDADGIPGAAFLQRSLKQLRLDVEVYIPSRDEGYGFSKKGIDYLCALGCSLIISVDLGIKEFEDSIYVQKKKCDLIITDHHIPDKKLPKALAVVNPKISTSKYPFRELSGGGVVFKIVQGLSKLFPDQLPESFLKWNLDLIAISTISDVVPMIDENRVIAKYGLISLSKTKNLGLNELYQTASLDPLKMSSYAVGFQIAPRINAPGRIDHASKSYELLVTTDRDEARELAVWLNNKNNDRQLQMDKVGDEVAARIVTGHLDKDKLIVVAGDWPKGVIGPSASRLVEKFNRPVIILSKEGDFYAGSSRSISSFNIVDALSQVSRLLMAFGGHKGAAGLQLKKENLDTFKKEIVAIANKQIKNEDLLSRIEIDLELDSKRIQLELFETFSKLEPFGIGNPRPVILSKDLKLVDYSYVGRDKQHLKLSFETVGQRYEAIHFSSKINQDDLVSGHLYDLVYSPDVNRWNGQSKVSLNIIDIKQAL